MTEDEKLIERMLRALELMYSAWDMLLPLLGQSAVNDYGLVCTDAPVACRAGIEAAKERLKGLS